MLKKLKEKTVNTVIKTITYETSIKGLTVVETIINKSNPAYQLKGKGPHGSIPYIVNSEFWNFIKEHNPWADVEYKGSKRTYGWSLIALDDKDLTLELIEETINKNLIVYIYNDGHEMFDLTGKIIPYVKYFNYLGTIFNNRDLDLEKAIEHLKTHDWIVNKQDLKIVEIPYYNADYDEGYTKQICLNILPDQKAYQKLYLACKDGKYWSSRLKDIISGYEINQGLDPLKLKKFLKKRKE